MTICERDVLVYLAALEVISVRKIDNSPAYEASQAEAMMLVAAGCCTGVGTRTRLKFLRLTCTPEAAEDRARRQADKLAGHGVAREVRQMAYDALQRMASARKFTFKEAVGPYRIHQHKRPVAEFAGLRIG